MPHCSFDEPRSSGSQTDDDADRPAVWIAVAAPGLVVRDESEWVAWLDTLEVSALRRRQIPAELSRPFTFPVHRGRLQEFVLGVIQRTGKLQKT